jgi:hypothetical protein
MLSRNEIVRYREMGLEQRYVLFLEMAAWAWQSLDVDDPETAARRWALIRRQHDESNRRLAEAFSRLP